MLKAIARISSAALFGAVSISLPLAAEPILTVEGASRKVYDRSELAASFRQSEIITTTTWTGPEPIRFEGPRLGDLAEAGSLSGVDLLVSAENGYTSRIPWEMIRTFDPILAISANGEPLTLRTKGPVFLVWPRSEHPELLAETTDGMWTWYANHISPLN